MSKIRHLTKESIYLLDLMTKGLDSNGPVSLSAVSTLLKLRYIEPKEGGLGARVSALGWQASRVSYFQWRLKKYRDEDAARIRREIDEAHEILHLD